MKTSTLEIDGVSLHFKEKIILSDIYLKCTTGDIVGLVGRNGSGKSSLLKVLFGSLKAQNQSIRINGTISKQLYLKKNIIKYLPQGGLLPFDMKVKNAIKLFIKDRSKSADIENDAVIHRLLESNAGSLSGGEKRYLEIFLLLFSEAKFVLLDEPFTHLSPVQIESVLEAIKLQSENKGIVITDHNYNHVLEISTSLILMHNGRTEPVKTKQTLFDKGYLPRSAKKNLDISKSHELMQPVHKLNIDKHTLKDLEIFEAVDSDKSIFNLLNFTETNGGKLKLDELLSNPRSNLEEILAVQESIKYLAENLFSWEVKITGTHARVVEKYISQNLSPVEGKGRSAAVFEGFWYKIFYSNNFENFLFGLNNLHSFLIELKILASVNKDIALPYFLKTYIKNINKLLENVFIEKFLRTDGLAYYEVFYYDKIFRTALKDSFLEIFNMYYELDALKSLAKSVNQYQFTLPVFNTDPNFQFTIEQLYHPFLKTPVPNDILYKDSYNFIFLTGPNMAGKTTFMKACGIAVYLAHVGMGVPARSMELGVYDSIFSSINISDNISLGYSYFFSEVKRVKDVAMKLNNREKIFIMFDELFKGTNVKDAYEGSKLIISGFCQWKESTFILSSHLIELEQDIKKFENIMFRYFDSKVEKGKPAFSFNLKEGLSDERLGLLILKSENILKLLYPDQVNNNYLL